MKIIDYDEDDEDENIYMENEIEIKIPTVYFAHSYYLRNTEEEKDWLENLQFRFLNHEIINPFDEEDELIKLYGGIEYYDKYNKFGYSSNLIENAEAIRNADLSKVEECDILVAYVGKEQQIGTIIEIHHAWMHDKKIYVICEKPSPFFVGIRDILWYPTKEEFFRG